MKIVHLYHIEQYLTAGKRGELCGVKGEDNREGMPVVGRGGNGLLSPSSTGETLEMACRTCYLWDV